MKKIAYLSACIVVIAFFLSSCETPNINLAESVSTFKIRSYQTRTYDTTNTKMVLKAMVNALQDEGFVIKVLNTDMGLITAERTFQTINKAQQFWYGVQYGYDVATIVEGNISVDQFGNQTKVRANFIKKVVNTKGGITKVNQIEDPKLYQEFFAQAQKSIFIEKEKVY
ncbi:MAG: hypothetical protein ACP5PO_08340 [Desulfurella sp.]|uniref:Uncharacterized protein n=1 Tax=Desulfurella multipotens TaxID=79269 RepID=A0A1G6NIW2_9BACT|nr:hypothetical protein [Desulfurella multipotens]SDC67226.1 hypothetical protein SAMN05660835_01204 [Desulfurella multipotens]